MYNDDVIASIKNVSKSFPGVRALKEVSIDIQRGEIFGLVGENDSDKSTLIKILSGIYRKDSDEIYISGKSCSITNPVDAQGYGLSFILQERNLVPFLTIKENIFAGRQPVKKFGFVNWKKLSLDALKILDLLKCDLPSGTLVNKLSIAEQQLIEIE